MTKYNYRYILFISDIHFGVHRNKMEWLQLQIDYFEKFFIPTLKKLVAKYGDEICLVHLGDLFEYRHTVNVKVAHEAINIMKKITDIIPTFNILGNHDIYNLNTNDISPIHFMNFKMKSFEKEQVLQFKDHKILFLPWVNKKEDLVNIVLKHKDCKHLFCHTDINGLSLNKKSKIDFGIDAKLLDEFKYVFSGHIHYRQNVGNVYMVGSPQTTTFADADNTRGLYLLDLDTDKVKFIENTFSPMHYDLDMQEYLDNEKEVKKKIKGNFVRLYVNESYIYKNPNAFVKKSKEISDLVREFKPITILDIEDEFDKDNVKYKDAKSIPELIGMYIDESEIPDTMQTDMKDELVELYKELI